MADPMIECPNCGHEFPLGKAITGPIEESLRERYSKEAKELEDDLKASFDKRLKAEIEEAETAAKKAAEATALAEMTELQKQLAAARAAEKVQKENFDKKLKDELAKLQGEAKEEAKESVADELKKLRAEVREEKKRRQEAQEAAAEVEKKEAALARKEEQLAAKIERATAKARKEAEEKTAAKLAEEYKDQELQQSKIVADLRKQLIEVKSKLDQRSQELQGEVTELDFEELLATTFPDDSIVPVKKGKLGADIIQRVFTPGGKLCGTIVWESKNTKKWAKTWLTKVKADKRREKAELAVIATKALPDEAKTGLGTIDGVWICSHPLVPAVATALRATLIEVQRYKQGADSASGDMQRLYEYLMSTEFRNRVEAIVEAFQDMRQDLDRERSSMERLWAKREKQIQQVMGSVHGMVGDFQAISPAFPKIKRLELPSPD